MAAAEATGGAASPRIGPAVREDLPDIFPRFGFRPIGRVEVPEDVRCSVEFVSACPESARAMAAELVDAVLLATGYKATCPGATPRDRPVQLDVELLRERTVVASHRAERSTPLQHEVD